MTTDTTLTPTAGAAEAFASAGWLVGVVEHHVEVDQARHTERWYMDTIVEPTLDATLVAEPLARRGKDLSIVIPDGWAALLKKRPLDGVSHWPKPSEDRWMARDEFLIKGSWSRLYLFRLDAPLRAQVIDVDARNTLYGPGSFLSLHNVWWGVRPDVIDAGLAAAPKAPSWVSRFTVGYAPPEPKVDHRRNPENADLDERLADAIRAGATRPEPIRWDFGDGVKPMARSTFYRALERLRTAGRVAPGMPLRLTDEEPDEATTSVPLWDDRDRD